MKDVAHDPLVDNVLGIKMISNTFALEFDLCYHIVTILLIHFFVAGDHGGWEWNSTPKRYCKFLKCNTVWNEKKIIVSFYLGFRNSFHIFRGSVCQKSINFILK